MEAMKIRARATCETGREGKGLTSRSEPRSSVSSCQPGNVARRIKVMKARTMATMLHTLWSVAGISCSEVTTKDSDGKGRIRKTYIR